LPYFFTLTTGSCTYAASKVSNHHNPIRDVVMQNPQYFDVVPDLETSVLSIRSGADVSKIWTDILKVYFAGSNYQVNPESITNGDTKTDFLVVNRLTASVGPLIVPRSILILESKYTSSDEEFYTDGLWDRHTTQLREYLGSVSNASGAVAGVIAINAYVRFYRYDMATKELTSVVTLGSPSDESETSDVVVHYRFVDWILQNIKFLTDNMEVPWHHSFESPLHFYNNSITTSSGGGGGANMCK